jgi:hypothetical protein
MKIIHGVSDFNGNNHPKIHRHKSLRAQSTYHPLVGLPAALPAQSEIRNPGTPHAEEV